METMRTANGLTVPVGYTQTSRTTTTGTFGGKAPSGRSGRERRRSNRYQRAGSVTVGLLLRGQRTHDSYEVLSAFERVRGSNVVLEVRNTRTGEVRHWTRRADDRLELA